MSTTGPERRQIADEMGEHRPSLEEAGATSEQAGEGGFSEGMGAVENVEPDGPTQAVGRYDIADPRGYSTGGLPGKGLRFEDDESVTTGRSEPPAADPADRTDAGSDSPSYPTQTGGEPGSGSS